MDEIRKVLGDLILTARRYRDYIRPTDAQFSAELNEQVKTATAIYESLPADGGAWYPSVDDVRARSREIFPAESNGVGTIEAVERSFIRAAIGLYKERGGQVGGEVVRWEYKFIGDEEWSQCSERGYEHLRGLPDTIVRELIARQPGAQPAHGPVVGEPVALTVPVEVMEAAEWCAQNSATAGPTVLRWLKSLQGAGHVASGK